MSLGILVMESLRLHELLNLNRRLLLLHIVGQFALHFEENLVDFEEFVLEVGPRIDQIL